jgi:hypothetical protein
MNDGASIRASARSQGADRTVIAMVFLAVIVVPGLALSNDGPSTAGWWVGAVLGVGFELVLLSILLRRVDVFFEGDSLRLESARWPLTSTTSLVAKADIRGVTLDWRPRGRSVRLALELKDGRVVPVTRSYFGHTGSMDADRLELLRLLGLGG